MTGSNLTSGTIFDGSNRNYSYLYDKSMYTSLWIAYPLDKSTCTGTSQHSGSWQSTPGISVNDQINIWDRSYNVYYGDTEYSDPFSTSGREDYSRGHQIPDADRQYNETMVQQTYYAINSTPQIQNKFNGGIWGSLETAIRTLVIDKNKTVYIVTGAAFQKKGEPEQEVTWILPRSDSKRCPVPNYYWKAVLQIKKDSSGSVTSASAVGFWYEHKEYESGTHFDNSGFVKSVNQIESWTGFDLFTNLPDSIEESVENNTSWTSFQNF